ncbi:MAG: hypothetical protein JXC85_02435 [Candidatus Aenigmarchaeota archaeon]|nr:hypothetical protein [Candidatus Aenigmarchaeota archaeon]
MIDMKDKTRLFWMKLFGVTLIAVIFVFLASLFIVESREGGFDTILLITLVPAAAIIFILLANLKRLSRGVKSGLPIDDELSQRVKERAGYLTCLITIYFVLGLMFYHGFLVEDFGFPGLVVRHAMMVILIFIIAVFGLVWYLINRRGIR